MRLPISAVRSIGLVAMLLVPFASCDRAVQQVDSNKSQGDPKSSQSPDQDNQSKQNPTSPNQPPQNSNSDLTQTELGPSAGQQPMKEFQLKEPEIVAPSFDDPASLSKDAKEKVEQKAVDFKKSSDPTKMIENIGEIDRSIDRLLIAGQQREQEGFRDNAILLAKMKLESGKYLAGLPNLTADQSRFATKTQLVALSHLSGLKDVQAAKQLEQLAQSLLSNNDAELKQQGKIVLFGFSVQNLQNGIGTDPNIVLEQAKQLVADERFRSRLEMTSLLHAIRVFSQMGYREQIAPLQRIAFDAFSGSSDKPLRFEAWNQLVAESPSREQFLTAMDMLGSPQFSRESALSAAQTLLNEFPNVVTLEVLSEFVPNLEYSGEPALSLELSKLIYQQLSKLGSSSGSAIAIQSLLNEQKLRNSWIGKDFELPEIVDLDGNPFKTSAINGKVVIVVFWTSWSLPCLKELPFLEKCYADLHSKGFEILSINMDTDPNAMQQFVNDHPTAWKVFKNATHDARPLTQHFGITMFPHCMLIDREGKVVKLHVRGPALQQELAQLLGN